MIPIRSPHQRKNLVITGERLIKGRNLARRSLAWMECNQASFISIYYFLKRLQKDEIRGRVRDRVAAHCLDKGIQVGDSYAFNNDYWAAISRYAVLFDPSLLGNPIRFRDSDIDCYGLLPVSYLPDIGKEEDGL